MSDGQEQIHTYVRFFYPGLMVGETQERRVQGRDLDIELPKGAFGFSFFTAVEVEFDNVRERKRAYGHSLRYFVGGNILSLEDVRRDRPNEKTLLWNMETNGYPHVLETPRGFTIPLSKGDTVLDEDRNIRFVETDEPHAMKRKETARDKVRRLNTRKLGGPS